MLVSSEMLAENEGNYISVHVSLGVPGGSVVKNPPAIVGCAGLTPGSGRSPA